MSIYQDLVELFGFTNCYNSVKRYVRGLKRKEPEQYDRLEFLPGEEAQVDYGQGAFTLHPQNCKRRRPRLFVMTLRYSRRSFRKVVWNSSQETWAKLHEEAFRYFGGVPQYVVLDNLKEGVLKPDIYDPELNPVFAAMLSHYGAVADTCRVADPNRKGTVENGIQHTQDTALKGREFKTIEEQNEWLMHWEERWAAPRIHGRAKRQVQEMFLEEKPYLKALPLRGFRYFEEGTRTVWDDGLIEVNRVYYAAAPAQLYSKVLVRIYETEIEIYNPETLELYRRHFINSKRGSINWEDADRIFNPSRQTRYFLDQASGIGPKTRELCEILFQELGRVGQRVIRGILSLAKKHSAALIEEASRQGIERRVRKSSTIRHMVESLEKNETGEKQQMSLPTLTQTHELIRDPSDYARFFQAHTRHDFLETDEPTTTQEECHAHVIN
jgi:transposase